MAAGVDLDAFSARADGAAVTGVREPYEYAPRSRVRRAAAPAGRPARRGAGVCLCGTGSGRLAAARFLAARGFGARPVAGGTSDWLARGLPVAYEERENVA